MIISPMTVSRVPLAVNYSTGGSYTYTIPSWCTHIDIVALGGGGGGGGGDTGWTFAGQGGYPGSWKIITLERGKDIAWSATTITGTVGNGGNAGGAGAGNSGSTGGATSITFTNTSSVSQTISAPGGSGGNGGNNGGASGEVGKSPGNQSFNGRTYTGGGTAVSGSSRENGKAPGGGGGGGNGGVFGAGTAGMPGAAGAIFFHGYMQVPGQTHPVQYIDPLDSLAGFTVASSGSGIAAVSGAAQWGGSTAGQGIALYYSQANTNDQYGAAYANTVTTAGSGIILHCDAGYTGYYGAVFYNGYIKLIRTSGRWTQNAVTEIATYVMPIVSGDFIEFWNKGEIFKIAVNGTVLITHTIPSPIVGPSNRYQGFGMYRTGTINSVQLTEWRGGDADAWGKT